MAMRVDTDFGELVIKTKGNRAFIYIKDGQSERYLVTCRNLKDKAALKKEVIRQAKIQLTAEKTIQMLTEVIKTDKYKKLMEAKPGVYGGIEIRYEDHGQVVVYEGMSAVLYPAAINRKNVLSLAKIIESIDEKSWILLSLGK